MVMAGDIGFQVPESSRVYAYDTRMGGSNNDGSCGVVERQRTPPLALNWDKKLLAMRTLAPYPNASPIKVPPAASMASPTKACISRSRSVDR